jgi:hypothetical protein
MAESRYRNPFRPQFLSALSAPFRAEQQAFEKVARVVHSSGHLNSAGVKWTCFEPSRLDNATSVFVIDGLDDGGIWTLGDTHVKRDGKVPIAHADLAIAQITQAALDLEIDNDPPRHAAIVSWPSDKEQIRLRAIILASNARVTLRS